LDIATNLCSLGTKYGFTVAVSKGLVSFSLDFWILSLLGFGLGFQRVIGFGFKGSVWFFSGFLDLVVSGVRFSVQRVTGFGLKGSIWFFSGFLDLLLQGC
jgi:hypothetical protein